MSTYSKFKKELMPKNFIDGMYMIGTSSENKAHDELKSELNVNNDEYKKEPKRLQILTNSKS
jgi:hypothetical protein